MSPDGVPTPPDPSGTTREAWFGNGTSALLCALRALSPAGGWAAVPPTICPQVLAAIFGAGMRPHFVDVEPRRWGIDPRALERALPDVQVVIAIHAYGTPCRIEAISALCRSRSVPLVEDCCQAEGASVEGKPIGGHGDVSVFSYGAGKILPLGGGGSARTRSESLADILERDASSMDVAMGDPGSELGHWMRFIYNMFYPDRLGPYRDIFTLLLERFGARLLAGAPSGLRAKVLAARERLPSVVAHRRGNDALYRSLLKGLDGASFGEPIEGAVPWRFNLLLPRKVRDRALTGMLTGGSPVSSWYPCADEFLADSCYRAGPLDNARRFDSSILNLWLDDDTSPEDVRRHAAAVLELASVS